MRKLGANMFIHCNRNMADVLYGDLQLRPAWRDKSDVYDFPVTAEQLGELSHAGACDSDQMNAHLVLNHRSS